MTQFGSRAVALLMSGSMIFLGVALLAGGRETHAGPGGVPEAVEQVRQTLIAHDQAVAEQLGALEQRVVGEIEVVKEAIATAPVAAGQVIRIHTVSGETGASLYVPRVPRDGKVHFEFTLGGDVVPWRACTVNFAYVPWREPPPSYHYQLKSLAVSDDDIVGDNVTSWHYNYSNPPRLLSIDIEEGESLAAVMFCQTQDGFPGITDFAEQNSYASIRATYLSDPP
jgi:hypothetical protein